MSRNYYPSSTRDDLPSLREVVGDAWDRRPPGGDDRRPGSSKYPQLPPPQYLQQQRSLPPLNELPVLPPIRHLPPPRDERGGRHTLPPIRSSGAGAGGAGERGPRLAPIRYTTPEPIMRGGSPYSHHHNVRPSTPRSPVPSPPPPRPRPILPRRPASALSRPHERTTQAEPSSSSSKSPSYQQPQPPVVAQRRRASTPAPPPSAPAPSSSRRDDPPVKPPSFPPRPRNATTTAPATTAANTTAVTYPYPPGTIIAGTLEEPPPPPPVPTTLPHPYHNPIIPQPSSGPVKFAFTVMRPQHDGDLVDVRTPSEKPQGILRPTAIIEDEDDSHKRYPCNWPGCGKKYDRPSSLEVHRHSHTGTQPYPCEWPGCTRAFGVKSNMLRHYRSHDPGKTRPTEKIDMAAPASTSSNARFFHKSSSSQKQNIAAPEASSSSNPGETAIADKDCPRSNDYYR